MRGDNSILKTELFVQNSHGSLLLKNVSSSKSYTLYPVTLITSASNYPVQCLKIQRELFLSAAFQQWFVRQYLPFHVSLPVLSNWHTVLIETTFFSFLSESTNSILLLVFFSLKYTVLHYLQLNYCKTPANSSDNIKILCTSVCGERLWLYIPLKRKQRGWLGWSSELLLQTGKHLKLQLT